jgi:hypothetical protein
MYTNVDDNTKELSIKDFENASGIKNSGLFFSKKKLILVRCPCGLRY